MRCPRTLAYAFALAVCVPAGVRAQDPADSDTEADSALVVLARADSARAVLVQPPGEKGASLAHLVRVPFHLFGAALGMFAAAGYGLYQLVDETGVLQAGSNLDRDLDAIGIHLSPDMIGSRSWPALVVRVDALDPLFLEAGASLRGYTLLRGGLELGDTLKGIELAAGRQDSNQLHFWGIGPASASTGRSDYQLVRREATLDGWVGVSPHVRLRAGGGLEENTVSRGADDRRPDLHDVFAPTLPFGATQRARFARGEAELDLDFTRVDDRLQLVGARLLTGWQLFRGIEETDARFQIGSAQLSLFAPLNRRHAVALRGLAAETWGEEGEGIPFYHLPALGGDDGLRGFRGWRFRDRALAAATAEWRYQVWYHPGDPTYRLDGVMFVDHGTVAPALRELSWSDFETTPGLGLRLIRAGIGMAEGYLAFGGDNDPRWGFELGASF